MPIFRIPIECRIEAIVEVEADSLADAIRRSGREAHEQIENYVASSSAPIYRDIVSENDGLDLNDVDDAIMQVFGYDVRR